MRWQTLLVSTLLSLVTPYAAEPARELAAETVAAPSDELHTVRVDAPAAAFAPQQATHWCWAASVENAFRAAGHGVSQPRIVRAVYGDAVNMRSGPTTNLSSLLDREWVDDAGGTFRARVVGLFDVEGGRFGLDGRELVDSLRAGRPLVLGTSSHAMLLIGLTYREVGGRVSVVEATVFDPWPGVGVRTLRPDEMMPPSRRGTLAFIADVVVDR